MQTYFKNLAVGARFQFWSLVSNALLDHMVYRKVSPRCYVEIGCTNPHDKHERYEVGSVYVPVVLVVEEV